jgi:hypothetical protein
MNSLFDPCTMAVVVASSGSFGDQQHVPTMLPLVVLQRTTATTTLRNEHFEHTQEPQLVVVDIESSSSMVGL